MVSAGVRRGQQQAGEVTFFLDDVKRGVHQEMERQVGVWRRGAQEDGVVLPAKRVARVSAARARERCT